MGYLVNIIKDGKGKRKGDKANPVDIQSYKVLYELGLIEDEYNLIKEKKEKTEITKTEKEDKKDNNKSKNLKS
tara:strand:+ start:12535 stop:12753 length:219 start_codon:yes stop_codon:yes gene_type:complete